MIFRSFVKPYECYILAFCKGYEAISAHVVNIAEE